MPQARPPKRPSDAGDGPDDAASGPKLKLARLERGPEEFSNVVKSKLQSYTRTGQACDRCKVSTHTVAGSPFWLVFRCLAIPCLESASLSVRC